MLDLSEEPLEENIEICKRYLERMATMGMTLEIELGVTGGEEDGVDNTGVDQRRALHPAGGRGVRLRRAVARSATASPSPPRSATCTASTSPATSSCSRRSCATRRSTSQSKFGTGHKPVELRVPRRLGLDPRGDPRGDLLRRRQDEHRHRPAVGVLGRHRELRRRRTTATCRARSATPRAPTSRTRSTTTPAPGCAPPRSPSWSASSSPSPSSATSAR